MRRETRVSVSHANICSLSSHGCWVSLIGTRSARTRVRSVAWPSSPGVQEKSSVFGHTGGTCRRPLRCPRRDFSRGNSTQRFSPFVSCPPFSPTLSLLHRARRFPRNEPWRAAQLQDQKAGAPRSSGPSGRPGPPPGARSPRRASLLIPRLLGPFKS